MGPHSSWRLLRAQGSQTYPRDSFTHASHQLQSPTTTQTMHASHSKLGMERQRSIRQRYAGVALLLALLLKPTNPVAWNKGFGSAADRFVMASRMSSLICMETDCLPVRLSVS